LDHPVYITQLAKNLELGFEDTPDIDTEQGLTSTKLMVGHIRDGFLWVK